MGGLIVAVLLLVVHLLKHRHSEAPETPVRALQREWESRGFRIGRDFYVYVREGRAPVVRLTPAGRKLLRQAQEGANKKKKRRFRVFDDS